MSAWEIFRSVIFLFNFTCFLPLFYQLKLYFLRVQGRTTIVVDDRPVRAAVTANFLQRLGMEVNTVRSLREIPALVEKIHLCAEANKRAAMAEFGEMSGSQPGVLPNSAPPIILAELDSLGRTGDSEKNWKELVLSYGVSVGMLKSWVPQWKAILLAKDPESERKARQFGFNAMLLKPLRKANVAGCLGQVLKPVGGKKEGKSGVGGASGSSEDVVVPPKRLERTKSKSAPGSPLQIWGMSKDNTGDLTPLKRTPASSMEEILPDLQLEAENPRVEPGKRDVSMPISEGIEITPIDENLTTSQMLRIALTGKRFLVVSCSFHQVHSFLAI